LPFRLDGGAVSFSLVICGGSAPKRRRNLNAHVHYARRVEFDQLVAELEAARLNRLVYSRADGPLELWCYTTKAIYERAWSPVVSAARGLIINRSRREVVATPFPKFFNLGENDAQIPDEPFEVFEKVDGSLIVIFHDGNQWRAATKGSLDSTQVAWAEKELASADLSVLRPGTTYLAEAVYPENRIVINYGHAGLVLLGAYDAAGAELGTSSIRSLAVSLGWRAARAETFPTLSDLIARTYDLPLDQEGFVLRFRSGVRLKVKGAAYRRLHAAIAKVTPLGLWDAMAAGENLDDMRRETPEEYWWDFDEIRRLLEQRLEALLLSIADTAADVAHLTDKELGLTLKKLPSDASAYIFQFRRNPDLMKDTRTRERLLKDIRPQANLLSGYQPSYAIQRAVADG
jgi:RNA ligase